jgi:hypothetical protein
MRNVYISTSVHSCLVVHADESLSFLAVLALLVRKHLRDERAVVLLYARALILADEVHGGERVHRRIRLRRQFATVYSSMRTHSRMMAHT